MDTSGSLPIGARAAKVAVRAAGEVVGLASPHDLLHACLLRVRVGVGVGVGVRVRVRVGISLLSTAPLVPVLFATASQL